MKIKAKPIKGTPSSFESTTLIILFCIGIITIFVSFLLEFLFNNKNENEMVHLNFVENILLGAAASAIISYVTLLIPYINKKNTIIHTMRKKFSYIGYCYKMVCFCLKNSNENKIPEYITKIKQQAIDLKEYYVKCEFSSEEIEKKINLIFEVMLPITCNIIDVLDYINIIDKEEITKAYNDIFYNDLRSKLLYFVSEETEKDLSLNALSDNFYDDINELHSFTILSIEEISQQINKSINDGKHAARLLYLKTKIGSIIQETLESYED